MCDIGPFVFFIFQEVFPTEVSLEVRTLSISIDRESLLLVSLNAFHKQLLIKIAGWLVRLSQLSKLDWWQSLSHANLLYPQSISLLQQLYFDVPVRGDKRRICLLII